MTASSPKHHSLGSAWPTMSCRAERGSFDLLHHQAICLALAGDVLQASCCRLAQYVLQLIPGRGSARACGCCTVQMHAD